MIKSPRGLPVKETIRVKSIRKAMAQTMKASVDTAALSQVTREIDVTALQSHRHVVGGSDETAISLNTLVMGAVARSLKRHPLLNVPRYIRLTVRPDGLKWKTARR